MELPENKAPWRVYVLVGGALLSCGLGVLAMRRLSRVPERPTRPSSTCSRPAQIDKSETQRREGIKERTDAVRARSACSTWTQTFEEVVIAIQVPADVRSKDINCDFKTKYLTVNVKSVPVLNGSLYQDITPDECSWELDGEGADRTLTISLIKGAFHLGHWHQFLLEEAANGQSVLVH